MRLLLPAIIFVVLIALGMHTLLQHVQWETAMRVMGISMSLLAAIGAAVYLNPESK